MLLGRLYNECYGDADAVSTLVAGTWTHVAVVFDGVGTTLYKDGVAVATDPYTAPTTRYTYGTIDIGYGIAPDSYFDGMVDELYIFGAALSSDEVSALYSR